MCQSQFQERETGLNWKHNIDEYTSTEELNQEGIYKYLGVDESDGSQHSKMKEKIRKEYLRRVRLILRTDLNGKTK